MPLIQGGPPEWIWERTADPLKWEVPPSKSPEGHTLYELRVNCGLGIMRLQFFTREEIQELAALLAALDERAGRPGSPTAAAGLKSDA